VYDRARGSKQQVQFERAATCLALTDEEMWVGIRCDTQGDITAQVCRMRLSDFMVLARIESADFTDGDGEPLFLAGDHAGEIVRFESGALSPDGTTLFVIDTFSDTSYYDLIALDAASLAFRTEIVGAGDRGESASITIAGDELYLCVDDDLQAFALDGTPLRTLSFFRKPRQHV